MCRSAPSEIFLIAVGFLGSTDCRLPIFTRLFAEDYERNFPLPVLSRTNILSPTLSSIKMGRNKSGKSGLRSWIGCPLGNIHLFKRIKVINIWKIHNFESNFLFLIKGLMGFQYGKVGVDRFVL